MEIQARSMPIDERIPAADRELFARWAAEIFTGSPIAKQIAWVTEFAYQVVVYQDSIPVSYLRIVDRTGLVDGRPVRMGGVADVMTPPQYRRKGFGGLAVEESRRAVFEGMKAQLGLLFCAQDLVSFYARHGWQLVECPVTMDQPGGKRLWPECTMLLARADETWAPKSIDICGLPW